MSPRWTAAAGVLVLAGSALAAWGLRHTTAVVRPAPAGADVARGRLLFQTSCAGCHGVEGRGDGPAAAELEPPPRDFADRPWRSDARPETLRRVIRDGLPGTGMPGSPGLPPADVDALAAFVGTLAPADTSPPPLDAATRDAVAAAGLRPDDAPPLAPPLDLRDLAGTRQTLGSLRGRWVLVAFWGTACEHCLAELPSLAKLAAAVPGLAVLPVCADEPDAAAAGDAAKDVAGGLRLFVSPDGRAAAAYGATALPRAVLIDPDGRVAGRSAGTRDWSAPGVMAALGRLAR